MIFISHLFRMGVGRMTVRSAAIGVLLAAVLCHDVANATPTVPLAQPSPQPSVRVMTWNILGSNHAKGRHNFVERTQLAARIISGQEGIEPIDIVGMQEIESDQYALFKRYLHSYTPVPAGGNPHNAIFYRSDRFKLVRYGAVNYPFYRDSGKRTAHGRALWARLQDKTTQRFITVSNWHYVAWNEDKGSDAGGAYKRLWSAKLSQAWAKRMQKAHPKDIVMVIGDLNSTNNIRNKADPPLTPKPKDPALKNNRNLLPYCVLTQWDKGMGANVLQDSRDMKLHADGVAGHSGHCPDREDVYVRSQNVDWIFVSPGKAVVSYWDQLKNSGTDYASDHYPIIATFSSTP